MPAKKKVTKKATKKAANKTTTKKATKAPCATAIELGKANITIKNLTADLDHLQGELDEARNEIHGLEVAVQNANIKREKAEQQAKDNNLTSFLLAVGLVVSGILHFI